MNNAIKSCTAGVIRNSATIPAGIPTTGNKRAAEKIEAHENMPEIFRIIKRNYEILKSEYSTPMEENEFSFVDTAKFLSSGINPKFCTSTFTDNDGKTWKCVFEMCFCAGDTYTFVKDFPDQSMLAP